MRLVCGHGIPGQLLDATIWRQKMAGAHKHTATYWGGPPCWLKAKGYSPFRPPPTNLLGPHPSLLHSLAVYPSPHPVNFKSQTGLLFSVSTTTTLSHHLAISYMDGFSGSLWYPPFSPHPCSYNPSSPE